MRMEIDEPRNGGVAPQVDHVRAFRHARRTGPDADDAIRLDNDDRIVDHTSAVPEPRETDRLGRRRVCADEAASANAIKRVRSTSTPESDRCEPRMLACTDAGAVDSALGHDGVAGRARASDPGRVPRSRAGRRHLRNRSSAASRVCGLPGRPGPRVRRHRGSRRRLRRRPLDRQARRRRDQHRMRTLRMVRCRRA